MNRRSMQGLEFVGVLANVDSTILKIHFSEGTSVEAHAVTDAVRFLAELGNVNPSTMRASLFISASLNAEEQRVYFVRRRVGQGPPQTASETETLASAPDNSLVVLAEKLRLARLFKKGNLQMPLQYAYTEQAGQRILGMSGGFYGPIVREAFTLTEDETNRLNRFLKDSALPFARPYVDLAFRAFESSYTALGTGLPFLALSSGLEALINPADQEIRYRLSRNVAALIARTRDEFTALSKRVKKLYDKRSAFIHGGDESEINREEVTELREILRACILRVNELNIDKDSLMSSLDLVGFPLEFQQDGRP